MIVRWNEIAERTVAENSVPVPASSLYFGFASLAVYDAVVTIEGGYEPWIEQPRAHANASSEAAAATAAYDVLRHYFPARRTRSPPTTPPRWPGFPTASARCTAPGWARPPPPR